MRGGRGVKGVWFDKEVLKNSDGASPDVHVCVFVYHY